MDVIRHQAIRPHFHHLVPTPLPHQINVGLVVLGAEERLLPPIPPLGDVVRETRGDYPSNARHGASALFPYSRSGVQYGVPGIRQVEIADEFEEVRLLLHHDGLVAVVPPVEGPGVAGEECAHTASEGPLPRPEQEVRVVREQGPGVHGEGSRLDQSPHPGAEIAPIGVVPEDAAALESSHHHVVEDAGSIEARLTGHDQQKLPQSHFRSNVPYTSRIVPYISRPVYGRGERMRASGPVHCGVSQHARDPPPSHRRE